MLNATINNGSVAQLNRALDYGSRGYRFESCRNHLRTLVRVSFFLCGYKEASPPTPLRMERGVITEIPPCLAKLNL